MFHNSKESHAQLHDGTEGLDMEAIIKKRRYFIISYSERNGKIETHFTHQ